MESDNNYEIFSEYSDYSDSVPNLVYEKYELYSSDGIFIGFSSKRKIKFYAKRQKYCTVDHSAKKIIFNTPYDSVRNRSVVHYDKLNQCVVCGDAYNLSATKIIPNCFTRNFPPEIKTGSENTIAVCKTCLCNVAHYIESYKKKLYQEYNLNIYHYKNLNKISYCYRMVKLYLKNSTQIHRSNILKKITKILCLTYFKQKCNNKLSLTKEQLESFVNDVEENKIINPSRDYLNDELIERYGDMAKFKKQWLHDFNLAIEMPFVPKIIS